MNNKLIARAILLEQFENGMDVQKAIRRVIAELGPEVIKEKEAVEWYTKFTDGDTDISDQFYPNDQFYLHNEGFLKWIRATVTEFDNTKYADVIKSADGCSLITVTSHANGYILFDPIHRIEKNIELDWSNFPHAKGPIQQLEPLRLLNDNHVFGTMSITPAQRPSEKVMFCGTLDLTACTLKFNDLLQFEADFDYYTIKGKTTNQVVTVLLPDAPAPTQISIVNIENDKLTIERTIEGPSQLIMATLRGDKLYGLQNNNPKHLVEFSLTDQTTQIHEIQKGDLDEYIVYFGNTHLWIDDVLFLANNYSSTGITSIFMLDLVGLEWKKTEYKLRASIHRMFTNNDKQLIVSVRENDHYTSIHQFQYNATDSLANSIWKAVCRYSQDNQQFFQWFQNKLPESSKFRTI